MSQKLTVKGKSGRVYEVKTHQYGDNNVEHVLLYEGIVMAVNVRPLRGKGCDTGFKELIDRAEIMASTLMIHVEK